MMFQLDTAFAVESMALVLGTFLLAWMSKNEVKCWFSKFVGVFVIVVSLLGMICTFYYGLLYRSWGLFDDPDKVMKRHGGMMMEMMKDKGPMMEKMMGKPSKGPEEKETPPKGPEDHGGHAH